MLYKKISDTIANIGCEVIKELKAAGLPLRLRHGI
jgi:hypothetical protein